MNKIISRISKKYRIYKKIQKVKKEESWGKHGTTADWFSNLINAIVAGFTIGLFYLTSTAIQKADDANKISDNSLKYTKTKDTIESISNAKKDSINKSQVDSSLSITKRSSEAAIASLELYKKLADATQKQTEVSINSAKFYKKSFEIQNRAYLIVSEIVSNFTSFDTIQTKVQIKNIGKTPASKVKINRITFFSNNESSIDTNQINRGFINANQTYIGSEQTAYVNKKYGIEHSILDNYIKHNINFYILTEVRYFDVFGLEHKTRTYAFKKFGETEFTFCNIFNDYN